MNHFIRGTLLAILLLSFLNLLTPTISAQELVASENPSLAPIKIGVLYPTEGAASAYVESLQKAIDAVTTQLTQNPNLPQVEFISAALSNNEASNRRVIRQLISEDVIALIGPNLLSAMITASPKKLNVIPLVAKVGLTSDLVLAGENTLYADLSTNLELQRSIQRLKYRGNLGHVIMLYNPRDQFGQLGYQIAVEILTAEKASFSTEIFSDGATDFVSKLEKIKDDAADATIVIVARGDDVADVIFRAHEEVGLTGEIIGVLGDGNPAIFDLADSSSLMGATGTGWDITPTAALTNLASEQFGADRFAAESYLALWSLIHSIDHSVSQPRATVRNTFVTEGSDYLERSTARFADWWLKAVHNSVSSLDKRLSSSQVAQINWLVSADSE